MVSFSLSSSFQALSISFTSSTLSERHQEEGDLERRVYQKREKIVLGRKISPLGIILGVSFLLISGKQRNEGNPQTPRDIEIFIRQEEDRNPFSL